MSAARHEIETTYINLWAETEYALVVNSAVAQQMQRLNIDLVDVNHVLKTGSVVRSDMIESRGHWNVRGETVDEARIELSIAVVSSEYEVELLRIEKLKGAKL